MTKPLKRMQQASAAIREGGAGQPKYRLILESLREAITSGEYAPGARLPSESELVRRFAVSRMTVVKSIKELQRQALVTRRPGSGTYVSAGAVGNGRLFGLLIPDLGQTEIFEPICQGMASYPAAAQHSLLWGSSMGNGAPKEQAAEELCRQYIAQKVSGVFFAPLELTTAKDAVNRSIVELLDRANIPVVLLDRCVAPYPHRSRYDLVGIDNRRTAYQVTLHLVHAGAQRIAFLGKKLSASTVDARVAGYREAMYGAGLLRQEELVTRGDPSDVGLIAQVLETQRPDAFVCANDHTAANLMHSLIRLNRRVPEDIRIVGIDDVKYASLLPIPLTTQHQPCQDLGRVAMATMLERLQNPSLPRRDVLLDCRMIVRASCGTRRQS